MSQQDQLVNKVVYTQGNISKELTSAAPAGRVFTKLKDRFPELANASYSVSGGVLTVELRAGSKA